MLVTIKNAINDIAKDGLSIQTREISHPPFTHTYTIKGEEKRVDILITENSKPPTGIEVVFRLQENSYVLPVTDIWPDDEVGIANDLANGVKNFFAGSYTIEKRGILFLRGEYLNVMDLDESLGSPVLVSKRKKQ